MKQITIIGTGNVATHLCVALAGKADELISVSSRTLEDLPPDSDIYILAVKDDAIAEVVANVAARLGKITGILAHTSGSVPMDVLAPYASRIGVFYPLQTFSKDADLEYSQIPVFVEGCDSGIEAELKGLAALFTSHLYTADSDRRRILHIASVFACNYVNHLWDIADDILCEEGLSLEVLFPLIKATAAKITRMSPHDAQTGPAVRGDKSVMLKHLDMLDESDDAKIYRLLGNSILTEYGHSPLPDSNSSCNTK